MQALFGQLLVGLINGSFYALLSLGLAVIFGLVNVVNFAHGALYMTGAFVAWFGLSRAGDRLLAGAAALAAGGGRCSAWCWSAPCCAGSTSSTTSTVCSSPSA